MAYGFIFKNNNNQVIIDDTNVKPWFITDINNYVGRNYETKDVTDSFPAVTQYPPLNTSTNQTDTWRVFELKYIAPSNADCFVVYTLPDSTSSGIWYTSSDKPITKEADKYASWNQITLNGTYIGNYPIFTIYALVPQSWIISASEATKLAAFPKVYYYAGIPIPSGSLSRGYGMQVFNASQKATYDSGKYHVQVTTNSFPSPRIPNAVDFAGSDFVGPLLPNGHFVNDTTVYSPGSSMNTTGFVIPDIKQRAYFYNNADSTKGYVKEWRTFFQRIPGTSSNNSTLKTRSINTITYNVLRSSYPGVANGTLFNYGLKTFPAPTWNNGVFYVDLFAADIAKLGDGYTPTQFPAGYVLSGNTTGTFEYINVGSTPDLGGGVITLTTYNVPDGTVVPYTITGTGITSSDFSAMYMNYTSVAISLTGSFTVNTNTARFSFNLAGDTVLEGTETFTLALNNGLASITFQIKEQKVYALSWVGLGVDEYKFNEGTTATARLTTWNVPNGTQVAYEIKPYGSTTQPNSADFNNASLTGNFTVNTGGATNSNGTADLNLVITADNSFEGAEGFQITLPVVDPTSALTLVGEITDTSKPPPTYNILNPSSSYTGRVDLNEGTTYTFALITTNVTAGTILYPVMAAPLTADANTDISASWYNNATQVNTGISVSSTGTTYFSFTVVADATTETEEYFTLGINNAAGTRLTTYPSLIYIQDTSQEPPEIYTVSANYDDTLTGAASEGNMITFTMTAAEDYGHDVFWTLEGTNFNTNDISSMRYYNPSWVDNGLPRYQTISKSLQGTFIFPDSLDKALQVTLANDISTEGPEIVTLKLRQTSYTSAPRASKAVYIKDTSRGAVDETITAPTNTALAGELNITWAGGYGDDTVYYEIDALPTVGVSPSFTLDSTGYANNPTAGVGIAPGTYMLYCYYLGSGHTRTFQFTIMPNYSIVPNVTSINEGGSVTWTVKAPLPDNTLLYWTNTGTTDAADFNDAYGNVNIGSVSITSYTGQFTRTLRNDATTEGAQTIIMRLDTGGNNQNLRATSAAVTVNDTSQTAVLSTDATLSALAVSNSSLSPAFSSSTISYTVSVANSVTSYTVTPTVNQANATITVNGSAVSSGSASQSISLSVGSNTITVVVTAQNGTTTKTYTVTVTRASATPTYAVSANVTSVNEGGTGSTVTYTVTTTNLPTGTVVYWTSLGSSQAADWTSNTMSGSVTINASGSATFTRTAFADNMTETTAETDWIFLYSDASYSTWTGAYSAQVTINDTSQTAAQSTDSTLSALGISAGTLSPTFSSGTANYTASVSNATSSITVTPTVNQANATVKVNSTATTSGTGRSVSLNVGDNSISIEVTAQNGSLRYYAITVTRAAAVTYSETVVVSPTSWLTTGSTTVTISGAVPTAGGVTSSFNYGINDPTCPTFGANFDSNGYWQNTAAFAGSAAGTYTLYVKFNATGTVRTISGLTISAPAALSISNISIAGTAQFYDIEANPPGPTITYQAIKIKGMGYDSIDHYMTRTFTVSQACTITCYLTVSSEYRWDYGFIYVDGVALTETTWPAMNTSISASTGDGGLSGNSGSTGGYVGNTGSAPLNAIKSYGMTKSLSAGQHTVKVRYFKDASGSLGDDYVLGEWALS